MIDPIRELEARKAGRSLRAIAQEIGVTAPYIHDILRGRRDPGPKVLEYLGLEKTVKPARITYRRASQGGREA
jgi:transcriptional regulator with XRE-family HTH domain